jgi:ubiquinone/menaquinone biosynthesis C-methylase UbiE
MMKDPYRNIAKRYDAIFKSMNAGLISIGLKMFPPAAGTAVLDVGCGTGTQLARYQQAGCAVTGIDPSMAMLDVARVKLGETAVLHHGSATEMPFDDGSFDLITSTLVLHEMAPEVRADVMQEMKRVLGENGRLLLIDFHPGPLRLLKGLFTKVFITISEIIAGREHYRHYRDFMRRKGLPYLATDHSLTIAQQKVVSGGNMALFLLQK